MTEQEKRRLRQNVRYADATEYQKGVLDCVWWLTMESDLELHIAKRLGQQMDNRMLIRLRHTGARR